MQNLVQIRYKHIFEQPEKSRSVTHGQDNPRTVAPCFDLPPRIGRNDTQHTRQTGRCQSPLLHLASQRQPCLIYAFVIFTVVQTRTAHDMPAARLRPPVPVPSEPVRRPSRDRASLRYSPPDNRSAPVPRTSAHQKAHSHF